MKKLFHVYLILLFSGFSLFCRGQTATNVQLGVLTSLTPYTVISRSANSQVWERTTYEPLPSGKIVPHKHHVTELATGLNYWNGRKWNPSVPSFQISADGQSVYANNVQHKVRLAANLSTESSISITTPDGIVLQTTPVAIGLYDETTSNTVIIAAITNCSGTLIASNQVIYENAFDNIAADIVYTLKRGSFGQDIVLKQNIDPADYGLSSNSMIEVFTEFYHSKTPKVIGKSLRFGQMSFGQGRAYTAASTNQTEGVPVSKEFITISGRTFLIESVKYNSLRKELKKLPQGGASQSARVKNIRTMKGGYANIPSPHATTKATVLIKQIQPLVAEISQPKGVVVDYEALDGTMPEPMVFQGDTTYFISGWVDCDDVIFEGGTVIKYPNDTTADIEVDGYPTFNTGSYRPAIFTAGDDDTVGESMKGVWDNYTGIIQSSGGYSGTFQSGGYANPALDLEGTDIGGYPASLPIENCRFLYAQQACVYNSDFWSGAGPCFYDCQILDCGGAISCNLMDYSYVLFANCLVGNVNLVAFDNGGIVTNVFYCYDSTFYNCSDIFSLAAGTGEQGDMLVSVNSIFSTCNLGDGPPSVNWYGAYNGFYFTYITFGDPAFNDPYPPHVTVGAGKYYLVDDTFRGIGTTNIDQVAQCQGVLYFEAASNILADLATKTTYPPTVYDVNDVSFLGTLSPIVPRDTNGLLNGYLDLGYHYDTLDYVFGGCDLYSDLTFTNGTAVGWFEDNNVSVNGGSPPFAISLDTGASLSLNGNVTQPDYFVKYNTVQEGANGTWTNSGDMGALMLNGTTPFYGGSPNFPPTVSANFTKFAHDPTGGNLFRDDWALGAVSFENCEFYTGIFSTYFMQYAYFTNCLFFRYGAFYYQPNTEDFCYAINLSYDNCTFYNGSLDMTRYEGSFNSSFWRIENCAFDGTAFQSYDEWAGNTNFSLFDYNSYNTNNFSWTNNLFLNPSTNTLEAVGSDDVMVNDYNWQNNWFGSFYLPSDSLLRDKGSGTADQFGLYYFTTQTNQIPETNSLVDIGYHYVAVDSNGNSLDEIDLILTNQVVSAGSVVVFAAPVSSSCGGPFNYQWLHDGTNILSGAGSSIITTVAGNGGSGYSGDNNWATEAGLSYPNGAAVDGAGNLYIADSSNNVVRMVSADGIITTVAGNGSQGYAGDNNLATAAQLWRPTAVALDNSGNLYIADTGNNVIREVAANGIISTVAGNTNFGGTYSGDFELATNAGLWNPSAVVVDPSGNLYIADSGNNVIREVTTNGIIITVAGENDIGGSYSGDGGPAIFAGMNQPSGVALDNSGNLYIADSGDSLILKVDTNAFITAYAGDVNEGSGYSGDWGQAINAQLNQPLDVTLDNAGNLYFSDTYNQVIRKVDTNGIITTVAGNFNIGAGYFGDGGLSISAALNDPVGIALDSAGNNLYIADSANNVIRHATNLLTQNPQELELSGVSTNDAGCYQVIVSSPCGSVTSSIATLTVVIPPIITTQPVSQVVVQGSNVMFNVAASGTMPLAYQWLFNGSPISGATGNSYTLTNAQLTNASSYSVVVSNVVGTTTSDDADLTVVGMNGVIVNGSSPPNPGPLFACSGNPVMLQAVPNPLAASFPSGVPVWTIKTQPLGSSLGNPPVGNSTATITPVVIGQYVVQAACGTSTATFTINCVGEADSDYDGICDCQELSDGTDPADPSSVLPVRLAYWDFDNTNTWIGAEGQLPLVVTNVIGVSSWDTNAVEISATNALLVYRDVEANSCYANLNLRTGTVRFWFRPDWSSANVGGTGPQSEARLIEVGSKGTINGWWALAFDMSGTNLYFATQTNSALTLSTNLSSAISWSSNTWHQIVLTYSTNSSSLYLDGESVVTNGLGVAYYPGPDVRALGFAIGSSLSGTNQAKGTFDDLETFNYTLDDGLIQSDYQAAINLDSDGDGWPNIIESMLGTDPYNSGSFPQGITIVNPSNGSTISR